MTLSRVVLGAVLLLATAAPLAPRAAEPAGAELPTEASIRALLASGDTDRAIAASRLRVGALPKDADAHVLLATALLKKATDDALIRRTGSSGARGQIRPAEADAIGQELETAIGIAPERKDLYLGLVDLAMTAGRDDEAIRQAGRAGKAFPGDARLMAGLLDFASDAYDQGRSDLAGRIVESVFESYPRHPDAILAWAALLINRGDLARALGVLRAGAEGAPRNPALLQSLADATAYSLDFETAARIYARVAALDPSSDVTRLCWAASLHVSDPAGARTVAEQVWSDAARKDPIPTLEMNQDEEAKAKRRVTMAGAMLLRAIMRPPFGATDAYTLARSFWQAGYPSAALAETEIALRKDAALAEAQVLRAEIYGRLGLGQEAIEAAGRAEDILDAAEGRTFAVTRDEILALRGGIEARTGKNEEALATYARTSDPARYSYPMALAAEKLGRIEEARALLEKTIAAGMNPSEVDAARTRLASDVFRKRP